MVYGISLTQAFLDKSKQTESVQTLFYDRFNEGEFKLSEHQLEIMIVTPGEIPAAVGRIRLAQIFKKETDQDGQVKYEDVQENI